MLKLMDWADTFSKGEFESQRAVIRKIMEDPNEPYHGYLLKLLTEVDPDVLTTTAVNFFINANLVGWPLQEDLRKNTAAISPGQFFWIPPLHATCTAPDAGQLNMAIS